MEPTAAYQAKHCRFISLLVVQTAAYYIDFFTQDKKEKYLLIIRVKKIECIINPLKL